MTMHPMRATLMIAAVALSSLAACKKAPDDATLAASVKSKIATDVPGATAVNVEAKEGAITLTGTVENEEARGKVEVSAKSVDGVASITNNLTVQPPPPPPQTFAPDTELKTKVDANLKRYNVAGVTATVTNGEVVLTGTIKRNKLPDAMKAANEAAPKKVTNQLTIK